MTQEELTRFNHGNELSKQIESIKNQIDNIEYLIECYPRTESGWRLSAIINSSIKDIKLNSEEFWKCIETIIDIKHKSIEQLQQEFDEL